MGIKNKNKDPKITDFSTQDLVVNTKDGALFYKSNTDLFKVQGDNVKTEDIPGQVDSEGGSSTSIFITAFGIHLNTSDDMTVATGYPISWSEDHSQATVATYHYLMTPYTGTLKKINIYFDNDPGEITVNTRTHNVPLAGTAPGYQTLHETFTTTPGADTLCTIDCNTPINDNFLLVYVKTSNDITGHIAGNIVIEYNTST